MRHMPLLSVLGLAAIAALVIAVRSTEAQSPGAGCLNDLQCSDGIFCNGAERCVLQGGQGTCAPSATGYGCSLEETCDEGARRCANTGPCTFRDRDGDGVRAAACGGSDCADDDTNRFPGNPETCDATHDEDCDPLTFGDRDLDKDGLFDKACCNRDERGLLHCGSDPDDRNPSVQLGSQVCEGAAAVRIGGTVHPCPAGLTCVTQPNGLGTCGEITRLPASCTVGGRVIPHGGQTCLAVAAELAIVCEDGRARQQRCDLGAICVPQPNGQGWCQLKPPGWTMPAKLPSVPVQSRPITSPLPPPVTRPR
jgi:hypothetical protein